MAHNVSHVITGDKLVITVDIGQAAIKSAPLSSTGKTKLVGTSSGNITVKDGVTFSLNVSAK